MAVCDVSIRLDKGEPVYETTEEITGSLLVRVYREARCRALDVSLRWTARGLDLTETRQVASQKVQIDGKGEWQAGQVLEFPFRLRAPSGPVSLYGAWLSVEWTLRARADIEYGRNCEASRRIVLVASSRGRPRQAFGRHKLRDGPSHVGTHVARTAGRDELVLGGGASIVGLALGVAAVVWGFRGQHGHWVNYIPTLFFAALGLGIGLYFLFLGLRQRATARVFEELELRVEPTTVSPGESVRVTLRVRPRRQVVIRGLLATLVGEEWVRFPDRRGHSEGTVHTLPFLSIPERIHDSSLALAAGQERVWTWEFSVPLGVLPSFALRRHRVRWYVQVDLKLKGRGEWSDSVHFVVLPEPGRVAALP